MTKIVINSAFGGFGLSPKAVMLYAKKSGIKLYMYTETEGANSNGVFRLESIAHIRKYTPYSIHYTTKEVNCPQELKDYYFSEYDIERDNVHLVEVVEILKDLANGEHARLKVVTIPDDVKWFIDEYDGSETIREEHRRWS